MAEKFCKTCRWWVRKWSSKECDHPSVWGPDDKVEEGVTDWVIINDCGGDPIRAGMFTGPDFRCIHWEGVDEDDPA